MASPATQSELERVRDALRRSETEGFSPDIEQIFMDDLPPLLDAIEAIHGTTEGLQQVAHVGSAGSAQRGKSAGAGLPTSGKWPCYAAQPAGEPSAQTTPPPDNGDTREALEPFALANILSEQAADFSGPGESWLPTGAMNALSDMLLQAADALTGLADIRDQALEEALQICRRPDRICSCAKRIEALKSPKGE